MKDKNIKKFYQDDFDDFDDIFVEDIHFDDDDDIVDSALVAQDEDYDFTAARIRSRKRILFWSLLPLAILVLAIIVISLYIHFRKKDLKDSSSITNATSYFQAENDKLNFRSTDNTLEIFPEQYRSIDILKMAKEHIKPKNEEDVITYQLLFKATAKSKEKKTNVIKNNYILKDVVEDSKAGEYFLVVNLKVKEQESEESTKMKTAYYTQKFPIVVNLKKLILVFGVHDTLLFWENKTKFQEYVNDPSNPARRDTVKSFYNRLVQAGYPIYDFEGTNPLEAYKDLYVDSSRIDKFDTRDILSQNKETIVFVNDVVDTGKDIKITIVDEFGGREVASKWFKNGETLNKAHVRQFKNKVILPKGDITYNGVVRKVDGNYDAIDNFYYDSTKFISFARETLEVPQDALGQEKKLGEDHLYHEIKVKAQIEQIKAHIFFDLNVPETINKEPFSPEHRNAGVLSDPLVVDFEARNRSLAGDNRYFDNVTYYFNAWKVHKIDRFGVPYGEPTTISVEDPYFELETDVVLKPELIRYRKFKLFLPHPDLRPQTMGNKMDDYTISLKGDQDVFNELSRQKNEKDVKWEFFNKDTNNKFLGFFEKPDYREDSEIKQEDKKTASDYGYENDIFLKYEQVVFRLIIQNNGVVNSNFPVRTKDYLNNYNEAVSEDVYNIHKEVLADCALDKTDLQKIKHPNVIKGGEVLTLDFKSVKAKAILVHTIEPGEAGAYEEEVRVTTGSWDPLLVSLGQIPSQAQINRIVEVANAHALENASRFKYYDFQGIMLDPACTQAITSKRLSSNDKDSFRPGDETKDPEYVFYTKYTQKVTTITIKPEYTSRLDNETYLTVEDLNTEMQNAGMEVTLSNPEPIRVAIDDSTHSHYTWSVNLADYVFPVTGFNITPVNETILNYELKQQLEAANSEIVLSPKYDRLEWMLTFTDFDEPSKETPRVVYHEQPLTPLLYGEFTQTNEPGKEFDYFLIEENKYGTPGSDYTNIENYAPRKSLYITCRFIQKMCKVKVFIVQTLASNNEPLSPAPNFNTEQSDAVTLYDVFDHEVGHELLLEKDDLLGKVPEGFYLKDETYSITPGETGNYTLNINAYRMKTHLVYYGYLAADATRPELETNSSSWYGGYAALKEPIVATQAEIDANEGLAGTEFNYWVISKTGEKLTNTIPLGDVNLDGISQTIRLEPKNLRIAGKVNVYYIISDPETNETLEEIHVDNIQNEIKVLYEQYEGQYIFKNYRKPSEGTEPLMDYVQIPKGTQWKFNPYDSYFLQKYNGKYELFETGLEFENNRHFIENGISITQTQDEYNAYIFLKRAERRVTFMYNDNTYTRPWGTRGDIVKWYGYTLDNTKEVYNKSIDYKRITHFGKSTKKQVVPSGSMRVLPDNQFFKIDNEVLNENIYYFFVATDVTLANIRFFDGDTQYTTVANDAFAVVDGALQDTDLIVQVGVDNTYSDIYRYVPLKPNYIFIGWYDSPYDHKNLFTEKTVIKNNVDLYARWISYQDFLERVLPETLFEDGSLHEQSIVTRPWLWYGVEKVNNLRYNEFELLCNDDRTMAYLPDLTLLEQLKDSENNPLYPLLKLDMVIGEYTIDGNWLEEIPNKTKITTKNFGDVVKKDWLNKHIFGLKFAETLKYVNVPASYQFYGAETFKNFTKLEEIFGLERVTNDEKLSNIAYEVIGAIAPDYIIPHDSNFINFDSQFANAKSLKEVRFINRLLVIGDRMFENTQSLQELTLGLGIKEIGSYAFSGSGITKLTFPTLSNKETNRQILRPYAFRNAKNLRELNISVQFLNGNDDPRGYRFADMDNLISFDIIGPNNPGTQLGADYEFEFKPYDFANSNSLMYFLRFTHNFYKERITQFTEYMFSDCSALESIDFTNMVGLNSIGKGAFINCKSFKNLDLEIPSWTGTQFTFGEMAFYSSGLERLRFGDKINDIVLEDLVFAFSNLATIQVQSGASYDNTLPQKVNIGSFTPYGTDSYYVTEGQAFRAPFYGTKLTEINQLGTDSTFIGSLASVVSGLRELQTVNIEATNGQFHILADGAIFLAKPNITVASAIVRNGTFKNLGVILGKSPQTGYQQQLEKIVYLGGAAHENSHIVIDNMKTTKAKKITNAGLEYVVHEGWAFSKHAGFYGYKDQGFTPFNVASLELKLPENIGAYPYDNNLKNIQRRYIIPTGSLYGINVAGGEQGGLKLPLSTYFTEDIEVAKRVNVNKNGNITISDIQTTPESKDNDLVPFAQTSSFGAAFRPDAWPEFKLIDYYNPSAYNGTGGMQNRVTKQYNKNDVGFRLIEDRDALNNLTGNKTLVYNFVKTVTVPSEINYSLKVLVGRIGLTIAPYTYKDLIEVHPSHSIHEGFAASKFFLQNFKTINDVNVREKQSPGNFASGVYVGQLPYIEFVDSEIDNIVVDFSSDFYTGFYENNLVITRSKVNSITFGASQARFLNLSNISARGNDIKKITGNSLGTFAFIQGHSPFYSYGVKRLVGTTITDHFDPEIGGNTGKLGTIEIPIIFNDNDGVKDAQKEAYFPQSYSQLPARKIIYKYLGHDGSLGADSTRTIKFTATGDLSRVTAYDKVPHELEIIFPQLTGTSEMYANLELDFGGMQDNELSTIKIDNRTGQFVNVSVLDGTYYGNGNRSLRLVEFRNFTKPFTQPTLAEPEVDPEVTAAEMAYNTKLLEDFVYYFTRNSNEPENNLNDITFIITGATELEEVMDEKAQNDKFFGNVIFNPRGEVTEGGIRYILTRQNKAIAVDYVKDEYANAVDSVYTLKESINFLGLDYTVTNVAPKLFERNDKVTSVTFPNTVTNYSNVNVFGNNKLLQTVTFGNGYKVLKGNEFSNAPAFNKLVLNSAVTIEDAGSFSRKLVTCEIVNNAYNRYENAYFLNGAYYEKGTNVLLAAHPAFATIAPEATGIGNSAFYGRTTLTTIAFTDNLKYIGEYAFAGSGLTEEYQLNVGLERIMFRAFENATGITEIYIPETVTYIDAQAFKGTTNLRLRFAHDSNDPLFSNSHRLWKDGATNLTLEYNAIP